VGEHRGVALRLAQTVIAGELVHQRLQFAARELRVIGDRCAQRSRASMPVGSRDDGFDRAVVVELQALGLRQRPLEVMLGDLRRDVQQGAGEGGDGDAVVVGGVLGIEGV
jgi:hypothetical protein